jgi:hypothetical protein
MQFVRGETTVGEAAADRSGVDRSTVAKLREVVSRAGIGAVPRPVRT